MYNLTEGFNLKKFEPGFCKTTRQAKQMSDFDSFLAGRLAEKKELYLKFNRIRNLQEQLQTQSKYKQESVPSANQFSGSQASVSISQQSH